MRYSFSNKTKLLKNVCTAFALLSLLCCSRADAAGFPNGREIVQRSLDAGERNEQQLRSYVSKTRSEFKQLAQDGTIKSQETKTFDYVGADGFQVRSLIAKDDKPLSVSDRQKENARIAKLATQRKSESSRDREKRLNEEKEKQAKDHRFTRELLDAFEFRVVGEEPVAGRNAWILDAAPNRNYRPKELKAQMLPHLRGRIWIDQEEFMWAKAEADGVEPFTIGFSAIAKLDQGAHLFLEQERQPDGTWVQRQVGLRASGRIALVKRFSIDTSTVFTNFRKVPADQRLGAGKDDF